MNTYIKKIRLSFVLLFSAFLLGNNQVFAQLAGQLNFAYALPKFTNTNLSTKGAFGYELAYLNVIKVSDRQEGHIGMSYIHGQQDGVVAYKIVQGGFGSNVAQKSEVGYTMNIFSFDYVYSFYIIPDKLSIGAGANLMLFFPGSWLKDDPLAQYLLSKEDINGQTPQSYNDTRYVEEAIEGKFFNYGLEGAVQFMPNDWLQLYFKYNHLLSTPGEEGGIFPTNYGPVSASIMRIGLGYRITGSARNKRY